MGNKKIMIFGLMVVLVIAGLVPLGNSQYQTGQVVALGGDSEEKVYKLRINDNIDMLPGDRNGSPDEFFFEVEL